MYINKTLLSKFNKEEVQKFIDAGLTPKDLSTYYKTPLKRIHEVIKWLDIKRVDKHHVIKKNDTFFDCIDSEIKAYLLGYLLADGSVNIEPKKRKGVVYSYNYRISFCVSIDDEYVIKLYQQFICPDNTLKYVDNQKGVKVKRKLQCHFRWSSRYMIEKLIEYGIKPRKTQDIEFVFDFDTIPSKLVRHFIRGFFDGDGCITLSRKKYRKIGFVSTSEMFLQQLILYFLKYNIDFKLYESKSKNMYYYQIWTSKTDQVDSFYKLLYENSNYFLARKRNKFGMSIEKALLPNQLNLF